MAKDKRLLIARSIVVHAQRLVTEGKVNAERFPTASEIPVFAEFTVPPKLLTSASATGNSTSNSKALAAAQAQQHAFAVTDKAFLLPHSVVARTGRGSMLLVPHDIAVDCAKINKRYELFDAVVSLESLTRDERLGPRKAAIAASTFSRFIFDERCLAPGAKLPRCLRAIAVGASGGGGGGADTGGGASHITVQVLKNLKEEERQNLVFVLKQAGQGTTVERLDQRVEPAHGAAGEKGGAKPAAAPAPIVVASGVLRVRIGHCGMTAGGISENGKEFLKQLRAEFPHIARAIQVVNLTTAVTRSIQWMELQIQR